MKEKRQTILTALLVLLSLATFAQTRQRATPAAAGGATLTGCLNGPNAENAYIVTTRQYKRGVEVGMPNSDDLSKHAGHKVRLTGSWAKSGGEIGEREDATAQNPHKNESAEHHFK